MPKPFNPAVSIALYKLDQEVLAAIRQAPDGLTNSQVSAVLGLGKDDPKQWFSYTLLQRLITRGRIIKEERRYKLAPQV